MNGVRHGAFRISSVWTALSLAVVMCWAQSVGGSVSGRVIDPSGAVIPGATITARNIQTGIAASTQSDAKGYYVLHLPVGEYAIAEAATGFARHQEPRVTVTVGGDVGLDVQLQLSASQTTVQVTARPSELLTPNTASVQNTVGSGIVTTLPVEVSGQMREASSFLKLQPGFSNGALNGGRPDDTQITVDGASVSAVGFMTGAGGEYDTGTPIPSFAVEEFHVIGANADAQYGRSSTGVVSYVLKSGTNRFHGSAFEYLRNEALDARSFFEPKRGIDRENEFGFDLGGPIQHNQTFFYGYYDGFRYTTTNTGRFYSLLTPAEKGGDFSAPGIPAIYDPASTASDGSGGFTRQPFSCNGQRNVICPDRISPVSAYFASLFPDPTLPGLTNNYIGTTKSKEPSNQAMVKVDHNFTPTSRLSVSYTWMSHPTYSSCPFGNGFDLCGGSPDSPFDGDRVIANWNSAFTPNLLNHVIATFNILYFFDHHGNQVTLSQGSGLNGKAGLGFVNPAGLATINVGSYYLGNGSYVNRIQHTDVELGDDVTWIYGSHQLGFGFKASRYYTIGIQANGGALGHITPFGAFGFSSAETGLPGQSDTGFAAASFLLGEVDAANYGQNPRQAMVMPTVGLYVMDKWKILPNLTLDYGLRWDYDSPITDRKDRIANFDPTLANPGAGNLPGALVFAGNGQGRSGRKQFADPWYGGFGPRVGFAYSPSNKMVLHGAWGLMFDSNAAAAIFLNQQGFFTTSSLSSLDGGVTPAFNWNGGYPTVPVGPILDPTFANGDATFWMPPNGARLPAVENYNVGIQRQLGDGFAVDASYVGTQGHHLAMRNLDLNQLDPRYLSLGGLLAAQIGSAQATAAGYTAPYTGFQGTVAQALRPWPQYQSIGMSNDPVGNSTYNALQVRVQKTMGALSVLAAYTWSKNITNAPGGLGSTGAVQNYYDLKSQRAVSPSDVPQKFTAAYTWALPLGRGDWIDLTNPAANAILGGWTTSGLVTLVSGTPLSVSTELSLPAIGPIRPDLVAGQPLYGPNAARGRFDPARDTYINKNAFALPAPFTFGDAPVQINQLRGFGMEDWDVALAKDIPLTERFHAGLKFEFFNVLNTVNFAAPDTNLQSPAFGKITSIQGGPRNGQISLTLAW